MGCKCFYLVMSFPKVPGAKSNALSDNESVHCLNYGCKFFNVVMSFPKVPAARSKALSHNVGVQRLNYGMRVCLLSDVLPKSAGSQVERSIPLFNRSTPKF